MKKIISIILIAVVIVFLGIQIKSRSSDTTTLKIGMALALSGDAAPWGEVSKNAAKIAVDEINSRGGIRGKTLQLVTEDIKSSSKDSVLAVSKLINIDKVDAIMITWLDSYPGAESVVPITMPLISQDAAIESVNVPINHENVFSLWYRTAAKANVIVSEMVEVGVKTLYIVAQNDSYYTTLITFIEKEATAKGIQIIGKELINPDDEALTIISKISSKKPDAVFFGSYDEKLSLVFIKRFRELIVNKIALYGDEFIEQNFTNKNFNQQWFEGVKYYVPAESNKTFVEKYQKQFGEAPKFSAETTYDTVNVLAQYLTDKPEDVSAYMKNTEFNTVTYGKIKFDEIGGVVSPNTAISMKQITQGKIEQVR